MLGQIVGRMLKRCGRARRECEQQVPPNGFARLDLRRLLDDDVGVGATQAETRDAGASRFPVVGRPWRAFRRDVERALVHLEGRVWSLEVQCRNQGLVLEHEHGLDEPGDTRSRVLGGQCCS